RIVMRLRNVQLPKRRGEVMHQLHPLHAAVDRGLVGHGADDDFRSRGPQPRGVDSLLVIEGDDAVPLFDQASDQCRAGEARAAGDQDSHHVSFAWTRSRRGEATAPRARRAGPPLSKWQYDVLETLATVVAVRRDAIDIPARADPRPNGCARQPVDVRSESGPKETRIAA